MKKILLGLGCGLAIMFWMVSAGRSNAEENSVRQRKIVVFRDGVSESQKENAIASSQGEKIKKLDIIGAQVMRITPTEENRLKNHPAVERIDEDIIIEALDKRVKPAVKPAPVQPGQTIDWGISQIEAPAVWTTTTAAGVKVGVIDTGISSTHPDLKVAGGINTINPFKSWNDDNGHGSHVAGIIAGVNNEFGIVGAAPQADLYAIKVLNSKGSGYLSDIIEGLDWAVEKQMQVVNLSLGTSSDVLSFEQAIKKTKQAGITVVAAAGNSGGPVLYPAAYSDTIAVSATDSSEQIASFSSRGEAIDLAAPGVNIYSTYKGTAYKTLSGTSMASPHVAGVAALVLSRPEVCDTSGDNICDPGEVQSRLEEKAKDLGASDWDTLYGFGLVNARAALD